MLKFRDDILTFQKGCDFTKSLLESGYLLIIKEESEQDISLIPGQIDFPLTWEVAEPALPVLVCFSVPLLSFFESTFVKCSTKMF